jgi:outer membrane protein assembly factor BamE (lipoprotein component of BamABCDE complex)
MRRNYSLSAVVLCAALGAAGCAPTYTTHGFTPQAEVLDTIEAGTDTRGSVLRKLGRPSSSGTFDSSVWYYVASKMEEFAFYEPTVVDRKVVVVKFDDAGLVTAVNRYGVEDGKVVDLVTRTTPTFGRELTVLQQIMGNVGRVDPGALNSSQ